MWVVDAEGRSPRLVDVKADSASWAPDGARLAYASYKSGHFQIYTASQPGFR